MTNENRFRLMKLYDWAQKDMEYLALDADYHEAQETFSHFLDNLTDDEREIVELFLIRYAARSHHLLNLALMMPR